MELGDRWASNLVRHTLRRGYPLAESRFELVSRGWADLKHNTDVLKNHKPEVSLTQLLNGYYKCCDAGSDASYYGATDYTENDETYHSPNNGNLSDGDSYNAGY
jgi:hypothetical protein